MTVVHVPQHHELLWPTMQAVLDNNGPQTEISVQARLGAHRPQKDGSAD
ncbi:MAG TPA: hypothetical protein VIV12_15415 [Streptosporangiaceae bacterium]